MNSPASALEDMLFDVGGGELHGKDAVQGLFEELIAGDFRIEHEVTDFDGRTVTTNTTTWGAGVPLKIEPLQAVEEYVIEDGKIVSITWTPTAESTAKLAAVMAEIQAVEIITAVNEEWNAGHVDTLKTLYAAEGDMSIRFDDDGKARMAYKPDELQGSPYYTFKYQLDGTRMDIREIAGYGVASCGSIVGSYEIQLLENGNIQLAVIEDECGSVGDIPGEYEPLPGT